ncbi:MAG: histidine--tRNA ligase, partial [Candidatus Aenigmarchaeota archaeon]|nr:histidine--tRNA ligase [Candidatus Aenigmarchaeota archaeon]
MAEKFQPPRGTRDFLPEDMAVRRGIFEKIMDVFRRYGYGEVWTPAFEDFGLLSRKSGPEIEEEIYAFTDKSGRKLGLRFDPTVPICRIVASNPSLQKPIKFCYITNMWRYDRPGAGRWREFWQSGVELIGPPGPEADAEMLALVSDSLRAIGVRNFYFRISSRKIVDGFIRQAGIPAKKTVDVFRAIDKLDKIGRNGVMSEMRARGIDAGKAGEFMRLVEDGKSSGPGMEELKDIQKLARSMGAGKISTDLSVVRGIDYYTGFVFETMVKGFEKLGSVASGGRYDSLIGLYSGSDVPATGYGMGIDRLLEIVKPEMPGSHVTVFVSPVKDEVKTETLNITQQLRAAGISAETELMGRNIGKQLDYASKKSIPFALIVGPNEIKAKKYTLRDMKTGKESKLSLESVIR